MSGRTQTTDKGRTRSNHEVSHKHQSRKQQRGQHRVKELKAAASRKAREASTSGNEGEASSQHHELVESHFSRQGAQAASPTSASTSISAAAVVVAIMHIGQLKRFTAARIQHHPSQEMPTFAAAAEETHCSLVGVARFTAAWRANVKIIVGFTIAAAVTRSEKPPQEQPHSIASSRRGPSNRRARPHRTQIAAATSSQAQSTRRACAQQTIPKTIPRCHAVSTAS